MTKLKSPLFILHASKEYFQTGCNYAADYFRHKDGDIVKPFDPYVHAKLCVPATNISFALELAIKGCLLHLGKAVRGHNLLELYEQLPDELRMDIEDHYLDHDNYKSYVIIKLKDGDGKTHGSMEQISIDKHTFGFVRSLLNDHKDAFVYSRYLYDLPKNGEWYFNFREMPNFTLSVITQLGILIGQKVELVKRKKDSTN